MRLVLASRNAHKLRELGPLLEPNELVPLPAGVELPPEDGETFAENALGKARVLRQGKDCTIVALALMVHKSLEAAAILEKEHGISCTVVDVRSLVPLDTQTILSEIEKTGRLVTVEENPRLCGWGAEIASIAADECFWSLDGPILRITTPHIPLPSADKLEDATIPSVDRIVREISEKID